MEQFLSKSRSSFPFVRKFLNSECLSPVTLFKRNTYKYPITFEGLFLCKFNFLYFQMLSSHQVGNINCHQWHPSQPTTICWARKSTKWTKGWLMRVVTRRYIPRLFLMPIFLIKHDKQLIHKQYGLVAMLGGNITAADFTWLQVFFFNPWTNSSSKWRSKSTTSWRKSNSPFGGLMRRGFHAPRDNLAWRWAPVEAQSTIMWRRLGPDALFWKLADISLRLR